MAFVRRWVERWGNLRASNYPRCVSQVQSQQQPQTAIDSLPPIDLLNAYEIESILRNLFCTEDGDFKLQAQALRYQLLNILMDTLNNRDATQSLGSDELDGLLQDKRSLQSLLRDGGVSVGGKRSVAALARAGLLRHNAELLDDEYTKRSIATLAKNGQLPSREPDAEIVSSTSWSDNTAKRNLASIVRAAGKRNIVSLARQFQLPYASNGKRNIVSLIRNRMLPSASPKRNVAALAKAGGYGKRNIGGLARDWALPKVSNSKMFDEHKRDYDNENGE